jgi:large subunit ribosomal protein L28
MARKCSISGVSRQYGHRVSHANNKKKHVFKANIQSKKLFIPEENRTVKVQLSTRMIRTIDKIGLKAALKKHKLTLADIS